MFHLATNFGSLDNTANVQVNALQDDVITIANNLHTPAEEYEMFARVALGALLIRARDVTPSIQQVLNSYMAPIIPAAIAPQDALIETFGDFPIRRKVYEPITYQITNSGAGPTATYVFSWLRKSFTPAPRGQIFTMRGASTTAAVANTWTTVATTWEPQLQSGLYAVIGGSYAGVAGIAFSCIFQNQFLRPGGLGATLEGTMPLPMQRRGGMGLWGTFPISSYPIMRVLNGTTTAAHTFYLDLVRLA